MLRETVGAGSEDIVGEFATVDELYRHLDAKHGFSIGPDRLRAGVNGSYRPFDAALRDGDEVVFIPPVAGG